MSNKAKIEFYGATELLQKLEKAGANVEKEIVNALQKSAEIPKKEMIEFVKNHSYSGDTEKSFVENVKVKGNVIKYELGFSVKKGGIAAIFLNLGTPRTKPYFFIDNAIENNIDEIAKVQNEVLKNAFKGLVK